MCHLTAIIIVKVSDDRWLHLWIDIYSLMLNLLICSLISHIHCCKTAVERVMILFRAWATELKEIRFRDIKQFKLTRRILFNPIIL